jgi:hypothetical protein
MARLWFCGRALRGFGMCAAGLAEMVLDGIYLGRLIVRVNFLPLPDSLAYMSTERKIVNVEAGFNSAVLNY